MWFMVFNLSVLGGVAAWVWWSTLLRAARRLLGWQHAKEGDADGFDPEMAAYGGSLGGYSSYGDQGGVRRRGWGGEGGAYESAVGVAAAAVGATTFASPSNNHPPPGPLPHSPQRQAALGHPYAPSEGPAGTVGASAVRCLPRPGGPPPPPMQQQQQQQQFQQFQQYPHQPRVGAHHPIYPGLPSPPPPPLPPPQPLLPPVPHQQQQQQQQQQHFHGQQPQQPPHQPQQKEVIKPKPVAGAAKKATNTVTAAAAAANEIDIGELELGTLIGGGSFGSVFKAKWRGTPVAVKLLKNAAAATVAPALPAPHLQQQQPQQQVAGARAGAAAAAAASPVVVVDPRALKEFAGEVEMLARLRHPNICLFMGCCLRPPSYAIVTELVERGSLWDVLREERLEPRSLSPRYARHFGQHQQPPLPSGEPLPPHDEASYRAAVANASSSSSSNNSGGGDGKQNRRHHTGEHEWSWERLHYVANGIVCGMAYLHGNKPDAVLHRDLKSSNLLCDEGYQVKICDFGMSRLKAATGAANYQTNTHTALMSSSSAAAAAGGEGGELSRSGHRRRKRGGAGKPDQSTRLQQATMTGNCGTVQWMAPEVLSAATTAPNPTQPSPGGGHNGGDHLDGRPPQHHYSETADVFSFGVILWELLVRRCPYEGLSQVAVAVGVVQQRGFRPPLPAWTPPLYRQLVEECWAQDPRQRPAFRTLLQGDRLRKACQPPNHHQTESSGGIGSGSGGSTAGRGGGFEGHHQYQPHQYHNQQQQQQQQLSPHLAAVPAAVVAPPQVLPHYHQQAPPHYHHQPHQPQPFYQPQHAQQRQEGHWPQAPPPPPPPPPFQQQLPPPPHQPR